MRKIILPPSPASPKSYDEEQFITYLSDVGFAKCYSEQHPQQFLTKVPSALVGSTLDFSRPVSMQMAHN